MSNAELSPFVYKFRATPPGQSNGTKQDTAGVKVQKRNRPVVSCLPCRNRKSKCNREHPTCGTCTAQGTPCVYQPNAKSTSKSSPQDRLAQLENLVLQLMHSKENGTSDSDAQSKRVLTPPADSALDDGASLDDPSCVMQGQGAFSNGINGPTYVGPTHWESVLETISGLMDELSYDDSQIDRTRNDMARESLFNTPCPPSLAFILHALPDRDTCNTVISAYYNARILCMPITHTSAFQRQYEKFWRDPNSVSVLWISQMFSMLAIGAMIYQTADQSDLIKIKVIPPRQQFFRAAAQCLVLANWERPQRHVVEALFFYVVAKMVAHASPAPNLDEVWVLYGALTRQAYRLGYHKEPSQIPGISVFDAEMRRRLWHILRQFDLIGALQLGLPCNIQDDGSSTTTTPRNLLDSDFDEDCTELPPARKNNEITSMVYFIAKGALMDCLRDLLDRQLTKKTLSYDEDVMQLDRRIRDAYLRLPEVLRTKPMSESFTSPSWLILNRMKMDVLYNKCLCLMHRQHLDPSPRFQYSVDTCMEASMTILRHQQTLHTEEVIGGKLTGNRFLVTSMHLADFFLGAMVLGFLICKFEPMQLGGQHVVDEAKMLLRSALAINNGIRHSFPEATRFSKAIEVILRRVESSPALSIDFDFQSFSGPEMPTLNTTPDSSNSSNSDVGMQDFEQYLNNANNIDWSFIDAGLQIPIDTSNMEFNWQEAMPEINWASTLQD